MVCFLSKDVFTVEIRYERLITKEKSGFTRYVVMMAVMVVMVATIRHVTVVTHD